MGGPGPLALETTQSQRLGPPQTRSVMEGEVKSEGEQLA